VAELLDDVRRIESTATSLSNDIQPRMGLQVTPDTSSDSTRRYPFRRKKQVVDLLNVESQVEAEYLAVPSTPSSSLRSGSRYSGAVTATPDSRTIRRSRDHVVTANQRRSLRSRSPFLRTKTVEHLVDDVRRMKSGLASSPPSPSSPKFIPGQSCRVKSSSPVKGSPASQSSSPLKGSPASRGTSSMSSNGGRQSRRNNPFQRHKMVKEKQGEVKEQGEEYELSHFQQQGSPDPTSESTKSERSEQTMERNGAGSKSPFLRRKKSGRLTEYIQKVEVGYESRVDNVAEYSVVEVILDFPNAASVPSTHQSFEGESNKASYLPGRKTIPPVALDPQPTSAPDQRKPKSLHSRKSILIQRTPTTVDEKGIEATDLSELNALSTALTDLQSAPNPQMPASSRYKISFVGQYPSVSGNAVHQRIIETQVASVKSDVETSQQDVAQPSKNLATKYSDLEGGDDSRPRDRSNLVPPSMIALGRRTHVSELSSPPPELVHQRSLGDDSVAEIQHALRKVQDELNASKAGKKVSRGLVMKTLLEVADTIESPEDRKTIRRKLSRMSTGLGLSSSESSSSCSADQRCRKRAARQKERDDHEDSSFCSSHSQDELGTDTPDSDCDASSFSRWLTTREQKKGQWDQILGMFGLSNLWYDDSDLDKDWEEYTEMGDSDEDDIQTPPEIEKLSFNDYVEKITMKKTAPEEVSASQRKGVEEAAREKVQDDEVRRRREIADEEQMMRELEELDQRIRKESLAERLRRMASGMRKENEVLELVRRTTGFHQQTSFESGGWSHKNEDTVAAGRGKLEDAIRSRRKGEEDQAKRRLIEAEVVKQHWIDDEKRKQQTDEAPKLQTSGTIVGEVSILRKADLHDMSRSRHSGQPSVGAEAGQASLTEGSTRTHASWFLRHKLCSRVPVDAAAGEAVIIPSVSSTDMEGDVLSLGSIESHQFSKGTVSVLQIRRKFEEEMGLEEPDGTYTYKLEMNKRKAVHTVQTRDDEQFDKPKPARGRNRTSRSSRHNA
jgi:hypothetical protein